MQGNYNHPTADEIYQKLKAENPALSLATVYRNLNSFAKQGKIMKIEIPNASDRFDCTTSPHFHAICRRCSRIFDVEIEGSDEIQQKIMGINDFEVTDYNLVVYGVCRKCKDKKIYESEEFEQ